MVKYHIYVVHICGSIPVILQKLMCHVVFYYIYVVSYHIYVVFYHIYVVFYYILGFSPHLPSICASVD